MSQTELPSPSSMIPLSIDDVSADPDSPVSNVGVLLRSITLFPIVLDHKCKQCKREMASTLLVNKTNKVLLCETYWSLALGKLQNSHWEFLTHKSDHITSLPWLLTDFRERFLVWFCFKET